MANLENVSGSGKYLRAGDLINGAEGWAYLIKDGKQIDLFEIKNLSADIELETEDVHTLGNRAKQTKVVGWNGSGSMNIYYVSSEIRKLMETYVKTGKVQYFNIQVKNEDKTSSTGYQEVILRNVLLKKASAAKLDVENNVLDEDIDFDFSGYEILNSFTDPDITADKS